MTDNPLVLLIGGPSGVGKSLAAAELGRRLAIPWFEVDDLRLALQRCRATLPNGNDALYFFIDIEGRSGIWRQPPELLADMLAAVGEALAPAIEAVVEHHVDQRLPIIIEGDGLLPSLLTRPSLAPRVARGEARAIFLIEPSEEALLGNMLARARGIEHTAEADLRAEARAKWLFGRRLALAARDVGIPTLEPRPWDSLVDRMLAAAGMGA